MCMEASEHGSPVFIRVIGVIRGLFHGLFWIAFPLAGFQSGFALQATYPLPHNLTAYLNFLL